MILLRFGFDSWSLCLQPVDEMHFVITKVLCVFHWSINWFDDVQVLLNTGYSSPAQYQ